MTEDYSAERVPASQHKPTRDIALVRMGFTVSSTDVLFGFTLGLHFGFWLAVAVTLIYSIVVSALSICTGVIGQREGTTAALSTRLAFGREGSRIPSLALAVLYTGFLGYVIGITSEVLPGDSAVVTVVYSMILSAAYTGITLLGFQQGLTWISRFGIPLSALIMGIAALVAVNHAGGLLAFLNSTPPQQGNLTLIAGIALGISKWTAAATATPDLTRFARNKHAVITTTIAEFIVGNVGFNLFGIVIGLAVGQSSLGSAFESLGIPWLTSPAMVTMSFTLACSCVYGGGLAISNAVGIRRTAASIAVGALGAALGIFGLTAGLVSSFLTYLGYISYVLPLILGILLADYFIVRRMRYPHDLAALPANNTRALAALTIGLFINLCLGLGLDDDILHVLPLAGFIVYLVLSSRELSGNCEGGRHLDSSDGQRTRVNRKGAAT